jgi:GGDEF domain-containing protein
MNEESVSHTEATLLITQDNIARRCIIIEANEEAAAQFGTSPEAMKGQPLDSILARKTSDYIQEMLEFEADAPDLHDVLSKLREVTFCTNEQEEIASEYSLARVLSRDANPWFELSFPSARTRRADAQFHAYLRAALESRQVVDPSTALPDRDTCLHFFETLRNVGESNGTEAIFAAIRMDRFEKSMGRYGQDGCTHLMRHMANSCARMLSDLDVICLLNEKTLGVFLVNFSRESARVLLNRMRWHLRSHRIVFGGKEDFSVTASIAFDAIDNDGGAGALQRCEKALHALDQDQRNQLIEPAA